MPGAPPEAGVPGPKPPSSDPALEVEAAEWSDRFLPDRPLRFLAESQLGTCPWEEIAERTVTAFQECGLDLAEVRAPPYSKEDLSTLGAAAAHGYLVGESDLRRAAFGFFDSKGYASFVASVHAWIDPPLLKHEPDSEQAVHRWMVRVRAGRVHSIEPVSRQGRVRQYSGIAETEEVYGWIAPWILSQVTRAHLP